MRPSLLYDLHRVNQITHSISRFNLYPHNLVMIGLMQLSRPSTTQPQIQLALPLIPLIFEERLQASQRRLRFQLTPLQPLYHHLIRRQLRVQDVA